ncbi:hypothetical protein FNE30_00990 [Helicobacter pylori]|nr:hypothetical protein E5L22_05005 [Helicobacter pylori]WRG08628.1 hypothetical protein FNE30_00990 [Helicobacter pylori]
MIFLKKSLYALLISSFSIPPLMKAASFVYDLKFMSFNFNLVAPNNNPYWNSLTKMQGRLMPQIGVQLDKRQALMFGAWFIQNLHTHYSYFPYSWGVTMYYQYIGKNLRFFLGIVPRSYQIGHYPLSAFKKLFWFIDPTFRGGAFQFKPAYDPNRWWNGWFEGVVDWYGGRNWNNQPKKKNYDFDQFLYFVSSEFQFLKGYLGLGGQLVIFHNASHHSMGDNYPYGGNSYLKPGDATPQWPNGYPYFSQKNNPQGGEIGKYSNPTILDRVYYHAYLKADFKNLMPYMDNIFMTFGTQSSQTHYCVRHASECKNAQFYNSFGGEFYAQAQYKGFGIFNRYYFSNKPQMHFYATYGQSLYTGLPWYRAPNFDMIGLYYVYKNKWISVRADAFFNFLGGGDGYHLYGKGGKWITTYQQFLTLTIDTRELIDFVKSKTSK